MKDYVREYFDRHAAAWVEQAYVSDRIPPKFPLGAERVRLAIEGVAPAVGESGVLVDLGCGGGQLCLHAARLGWDVVGVDVAPGMIEEARGLCEGLQVRLVVGGFAESGLGEGTGDAVTAMGLIEYLPDDRELFAEAARLLRPGGRFAVSCRNRLYNLQSANEYTRRELEDGDAGELLDELSARVRETDAEDLHSLALSIAAAADDLEEARELDRDATARELLDHPSSFAEERRQHTPGELESSASEAGFGLVGFRGLHPHPLPPGLEPLAPHVYNRLALAWQRPLEASPLSLAFSTAFVGVFERT